MILTYKECIERYGSDYMLKKEIAEGRVVLCQDLVHIKMRILSFF